VWDIDEPAAQVVREIFQMRVSGLGPSAIARTLRERGLDIPEVHRRKKKGQPIPPLKHPEHHWSSSAVNDILKRHEYVGTAVTNRVMVKSYKDSTRIYKPFEEWTKFESAHPFIIDQDTFDTVQRLREGRRRPTKPGDLGVLNGKIYCEVCGGRHHIKRNSQGKRSKYVYYICHNSRAYKETNSICSPHSIRKEIIEQLVLDDIRRVFTLAKGSEGKFVEIVNKQSRREIEVGVKKVKAEFAKAENRVKQLDGIINQIYEDKVRGHISTERFAIMLGNYENEQVALRKGMAELQPLIDATMEQTQNTDRFLRVVKSYTEITELTAEVVNEFIERIEIGETVIMTPRRFKHWKNEKQQNIRIIYNYIGSVPETV
jgi:hypothetical protein